MGRVVKIILGVVAAFIALFVVAAIALTLFFDPNDFREEISGAVKEQTGRELTIDGDISLELFPWLAVEVNQASLGNAPGFGSEPMASFDSARFSVRLLPAILRQEVEVGAADIEALRLNLEVNESGVSNWDDLVSASEAAPAEADGGGASSIDVSSVEILDAHIVYADKAAGQTSTLDNLNIRIGRLTDDGSPVPVNAALEFDVQPTGLKGELEFDTTLTYDGSGGVLSLSGLTLEGVVDGIASIPTSLRFAADKVEVSTGDSVVTLGSIDLALLDMAIAADVEPFSYAGSINPRATIKVEPFSPRSVMHLFEVEAPNTADPSVLSSVSIDAKANVSDTAIALTEIAIKLDDTSFSGSLSVPLTAGGFYELDLVGDSIELARYMEPVDESQPAETSESVPVDIPVDLIRPLNARGKIKLERASLGDIVFENIELGMNTSGGKMRIHPVSSGLFGGSYNGDVRIDVSGATPTLSVDEKIAGVDLAKLAAAMLGQENVSGSIDGAFKLRGSGKDTGAIQQNLAGNMSLELKDGSYLGTDIWYEIRRARALLKQQTPPEPVLPARTEFSKVNMSGVVTNGVMRSDDLFAELPFMQLTGSGQVDIPAATVDYGLTARVLERPEFLEGATAEELDEFTEAVIPMKITGPLTSPSIKPDLEKLLRQRVEEEVKDKLKDKLKDLFD